MWRALLIAALTDSAVSSSLAVPPQDLGSSASDLTHSSDLDQFSSGTAPSEDEFEQPEPPESDLDQVKVSLPDGRILFGAIVAERSGSES